MEEKVTIMRLKVDLLCRKCYIKVKKVLCKFPQIRDQLYDEKNDTVTIRVICCNTEKIRDKLCCLGDGSIKSIEIVERQKPKPPPEKPEDKPKPPPGPPPQPPPAVPVVIFHHPGCPGEPSGYYVRPIYDSYGWSGPCYVGPHHVCLCVEET